MVQTEQLTISGRDFIRHYSDADQMIRKDGTDELYSEAIDLPDRGYTYSETDIPIEEADPDGREEDQNDG